MNNFTGYSTPQNVFDWLRMFLIFKSSECFYEFFNFHPRGEFTSTNLVGGVVAAVSL